MMESHAQESSGLKSEIALFRAGDEGALERLARGCRQQAWKVAWGITRNSEDAEDALQEALIRAWRHRRKFRPEGEFARWFIAIAARCAVSRAERSRRRPEFPQPPVVETPAERLDASETAASVARAMADLSPQQRAAIVLVDLEERTYEEAAEALGCSVGSVAQHAARGREKLRSMLGGER